MNKYDDAPGLVTHTVPAPAPRTPSGNRPRRRRKPGDIDRAVEGRDRLQENEQTPMSPGVPDSGQA